MNPDISPNKNQESASQREAPLSEKDFIQNGWSFASFPFWLWLFLFAALVGIVWGTASWYQGLINQEKKHDPFLEVTNRDFSVFLWQFPNFLKTNMPKKSGYLPGFLATSENFNLATADEFVAAPPELIFLYHTWQRLLSPEIIERTIPVTEFAEFLEKLPEWLPQNWKNVPSDYKELIATKKYLNVENLQTLSDKELPTIVRQAFWGWKNYFKEGPQINEIHPTFAQVLAFLDKHPTYSRPYWRNIAEIEKQPIAGLNYLEVFINESFQPEEIIPNNQLSSFLKVALFNAEQAKNNQ